MAEQEAGKTEVQNQEKKPIIQVRRLYKVYPIGESKVFALNGVDLTIREGEFCSIVGTSGSGKSTLLNMLAGLEKPTKGEVIIEGHHIERMTENELVSFRRDHVGFIFQSFNLLGTMDAVENVALPLTFRGENKAKRMKAAEEMLKLVGLTKQMHHKPTQMSGGQQQRVAIARAIAQAPPVILADEPTGNLDSGSTKEIMGILKELHKEGRTVILITHDNEIAARAKRIIRIMDGKIVADINNDAALA